MRGNGAPRTGRLLLMLALAGGYIAALEARVGQTGLPLVDGAVGLALGLFICSHPAAAVVDLLYLDRGELQRLASDAADVGRALLNVAVLVAGSVVTILGAIQFVAAR